MVFSGFYSFAEVLSLGLMGSSVLQFSLKNEQLILHSPKAQQIKVMVELFLHELKQVREIPMQAVGHSPLPCCAWAENGDSSPPPE